MLIITNYINSHVYAWSEMRLRMRKGGRGFTAAV